MSRSLMTLSKAEKEHILRWDETPGHATFYTHNRRYMEKLLKAGARLTATSCHGGVAVAWTLEFDPSWIRLPTGRKRKGKALTEGHKAAMRAGRVKSLSTRDEKALDTTPHRA